MIAFEEALAIVQGEGSALDAERVSLSDCLFRVLRQDVVSDMDMPPFDKSAMDGYACRREDIGHILEIIETIPAGSRPGRAIGKNQCAKIMTGAMMPAGADCVLAVEDVEPVSAAAIRFKGAQTAANICRKGEDVVAGQVLVPAGTRITPKEIAALALAGCTQPLVSRRPKIGIIATGDEIVEPHTIPKPAQIRNSNASQLVAQCLGSGADPTYYGIARDTREEIGRLVDAARAANDLVLLTGGVSMGDFDLVPGILKELGFRIFFDKVAIQPGKPTVFGRCGTVWVFGLPGNPVSSFIIFEVLVRELLAKLLGLRGRRPAIKCPLAAGYRRKAAVRRAWIPVRITAQGRAEPVSYHGSAHITALAPADGIITVPVGVGEIPEGTLVDVRLI